MQYARDHMDTQFGGQMCGATVLTTVVFVQAYELFNSIAMPIAEALNGMGVPAMFQFLQGDLARYFKAPERSVRVRVHAIKAPKRSVRVHARDLCNAITPPFPLPGQQVFLLHQSDMSLGCLLHDFCFVQDGQWVRGACTAHAARLSIQRSEGDCPIKAIHPIPTGEKHRLSWLNLCCLAARSDGIGAGC